MEKIINTNENEKNLNGINDNILVQKYGGTSVANKEKLMDVSQNVIKEIKKGRKLVVVVSAQGKTTNKLIEEEKEITENPNSREHDVLVSVGEQITISKLAMMLNDLGYKAKSYTGWQIPIVTTSENESARIKWINSEKLRKDLEDGYTIIVAGFQGVDENNNITTLGRGGSDTTAVAIAASLNTRCDIYTDVDGVLTADPRSIENAKKINNISYDEMLEFASMGAKVLHNRCVEIAKNYDIDLRVRTVKDGNPTKGTRVSDTKNLETYSINGVTRDSGVCKVSVFGNEKGLNTYELCDILAEKNIDIDLVTLENEKNINSNDIVFTIKEEKIRDIKEILIDNKQNLEKLNIREILLEDGLSKITVIGIGIANKVSVISKIFKILKENNIDIHMINVSEIKISVLVNLENSNKALKEIYNYFF
ncbi:MAG: aspartate kinase [Clostridiales bacterium]|nr:aspartate kinase [Clostridiales bacterium]